MKCKLNQIASLAIILLILSGCENNEKTVNVSPAEKKVVVQCFISPDDDTIAGLVTWSKPVIGTLEFEDPEIIINALVKISDGTKTAILLWNDAHKLFEIDSATFPIRAGKKYFLTVSTQEGKNVSAECEVPLTQNTTLVWNKVDSALSYQRQLTICSFKYRDHEPSVKNYFRLEGKSELAASYLNDHVIGSFKQDSELGQDNVFKFSFYNDYYHMSKAKGWLINCDYHYFMYHKTLQSAQNNYNIFAEPTIVYTNIEGGLGCFGAYNSFESEVALK